MSLSARNGDPGWRVTISPVLLQRLRKFGETAGVAFLDALWSVRRRLKRDPDVFGEPLYHLMSQPAEVRHAAVAPLVIAFAVYAEQRTVWLINAWLLDAPAA